MAKELKNKKILIEIDIKDLRDLEICLAKIKNSVCEGNEFQEGKHQTSKYSVSLEYTEKTDFIEKKIDGTYYQVFIQKPR
jgi:hypothetical protein